MHSHPHTLRIENFSSFDERVEATTRIIQTSFVPTKYYRSARMGGVDSPCATALLLLGASCVPASNEVGQCVPKQVEVLPREAHHKL